MGVPVSAGAQGTAADQLTGKLVITGASTLAPRIAESCVRRRSAGKPVVRRVYPRMAQEISRETKEGR